MPLDAPVTIATLLDSLLIFTIVFAPTPRTPNGPSLRPTIPGARGFLLLRFSKNIAANEKPSRSREGRQYVTSGLGADYVAGLKAFGAFEQIELYGLTLIERAVAVLLDCGEVYENVFPSGALDESISLRPVEPLYCSLLSHRKTPFPSRQELSFPNSPIVPRRSSGRSAPSRNPVKPGCVSLCRRNCSKAKDSWVQRCVEKMRRELLEPWTIGADFYRPAQDINLLYERTSRHTAGHAPQIISSIK